MGVQAHPSGIGYECLHWNHQNMWLDIHAAILHAEKVGMALPLRKKVKHQYNMTLPVMVWKPMEREWGETKTPGDVTSRQNNASMAWLAINWEDYAGQKTLHGDKGHSSSVNYNHSIRKTRWIYKILEDWLYVRSFDIRSGWNKCIVGKTHSVVFWPIHEH